MDRPKEMGHTEGAPFRSQVDDALETIVEAAAPELREAIRHEVAWQALRWFERATAPSEPPMVWCGGMGGQPLRAIHYAGVLTDSGPLDLCPNCHVARFALRVVR